ncbi:acetolactate synthase [Thalassobacter stenotrophicus]|uniref:thiamine pyrophosphate-binding protein n=1 Tax=Thalassobacter TaxID=266808 RepID=UPI00051CC273|nr:MULTISPECIES: thiamine pyrophosphate-binding protein [Thalassobacter]KGK78903.1 acetolactate synthase [Thalassobacter stenotrophicus]KGL02736.1 acetolactate synthase [Thalassobacter sp. 16PALIMAR09]
MTQTLRAADILAQRLYAAGCRRAFGMPGGEVLTLIDALERAGITFILCKHENAGGFMAEGGHHVDGAPAILVATVGPGAVNGVNVVANSEQDRVPMIVLTGCVDAHDAEIYTHQVLDHRAVFAPITKATFTLSAQAADVIADKALGIALEGRAGPVHIDVPISVADAPSEDLGGYRSAASEVALADVNPIVHALSSASKPLLMVGLDAVREDISADVLAFVERFNIPVVTTYKAKGIVPEDHPLCLGGAGLSPLADQTLLPLFEHADFVLCLGYDPIEMRTGWQNPWDPTRQMVVDIGHAPNHHYMHQASVNIVGDLGPTLHALMAAAPAQTWSEGQITDARAQLAQDFDRSDDWGAVAVIDAVRTAAPKGTIATVDSGAHRILLSQTWGCDGPRQLLQSTGLCTMGCAMPLAFGVKIAAPDANVIAFMGDAGFLMVTGELATAAEMGLPVVMVVFVDRSLALIEKKQRARQMPNLGVDFGHHDYAAIARAFGGNGVTVSNREDLMAAVTDGLAQTQTFTLIAAEIERQSYDGRF